MNDLMELLKSIQRLFIFLWFIIWNQIYIYKWRCSTSVLILISLSGAM